MTSEKNKKILEKLEEEGKKKGVPPRFLEFYQKLFRIQSGAEKKTGKVKPDLKKEIINERLEHGLPLIGFKELVLDWSLLKEIFTEGTATFASFPDLFGDKNFPGFRRVFTQFASPVDGVPKKVFFFDN